MPPTPSPAPTTPPMATASASLVEGPWNPGIGSDIPIELLPLATPYRPQNSFTAPREARELAGITGLPADELVVYRPQRLAVHELLARVTADYTVEDGERSEDLGINFRAMCHTLWSRYIEPQLPQLIAGYEELRERIQKIIDAELKQETRVTDATPRSSWWWPRAARKQPEPVIAHGALTREQAAAWGERAATAPDPLHAAALRALARVASAMLARHGRPWGDAALVAKVAVGLACNDYGADFIGESIAALVRDGAHREGYRPLPAQPQPLVLNTKGASAAGKSTLRPLQHALADRIGVDWRDFALVSPDIFRKFLLDYATLGAAYKYAGSFTGHELQVVDRKLDRHLARKAANGVMPHLLIDRFRFDTFTPASELASSKLLTRFADRVYLFFVITPPHATVERAWQRGLEVGRYKAVDDLLAHNIEAYTGMPEVFFTWALSAGKQVHYEFLDNDVAQGHRPRTVAFGWNGEMNVLDVKCLLDVDRYRKINITARSPDTVYPGAADWAPERNTAFLEQCARRLPALNFADHASGRVYLRIENGAPAWHDPVLLAAAQRDAHTRAGIAAVGSRTTFDGVPVRVPGPLLHDLASGRREQTLGDWNLE